MQILEFAFLIWAILGMGGFFGRIWMLEVTLEPSVVLLLEGQYERRGTILLRN